MFDQGSWGALTDSCSEPSANLFSEDRNGACSVFRQTGPRGLESSLADRSETWKWGSP